MPKPKNGVSKSVPITNSGSGSSIFVFDSSNHRRSLSSGTIGTITIPPFLPGMTWYVPTASILSVRNPSRALPFRVVISYSAHTLNRFPIDP